MIPINLTTNEQLTNKLIVVQNVAEDDDTSNKAAAAAAASATEAAAATSTTTVALKELDVLCGRGRVAQKLVGNRNFHAVIESHLDTYIHQTTKQDKSNYIRCIGQKCVQDIGFRFVKKRNKGSRSKSLVSPTTTGPQGDEYVILDTQEIYDKVGHALRDLAMKKYGSALTRKRQQQPNNNKKKKTTKMISPPKTAMSSKVEPVPVPSSSSEIDGGIKNNNNNNTKTTTRTYKRRRSSISSSSSGGSTTSSGTSSGTTSSSCSSDDDSIFFNMWTTPTPDATVSCSSSSSSDSCGMEIDSIKESSTPTTLLDVFAEQYLSELAEDMNVEKSMDDPLPVEFSDLLFNIL